MIKRGFYFKFLFTFLFVVTVSYCSDELIYKSLVIDNNSSSLVELRVVSSKKEIEKGLMGVKYLNWKEGMFFDFKKEQTVRMWMKGMEMPIDIIFLSKSYKINKLIRKAYPCGTVNCRIYSVENTQYVLELKAGMIDRYSLNENSVIEIK